MFILKNIFYLVLGLIVILWTFWNKIIRVRLPKSFNDFDNLYATLFITVNIIFFIMAILTSIFSKKTSNNRIIEYLLTFNHIQIIANYIIKLRDSIIQAPKTVYEILIFNNFNVAYILEKPFVKLSRFLKNLPIKYAYILTIISIIFQVIPPY